MHLYLISSSYSIHYDDLYVVTYNNSRIIKNVRVGPFRPSYFRYSKRRFKEPNKNKLSGNLNNAGV